MSKIKNVSNVELLEELCTRIKRNALKVSFKYCYSRERIVVQIWANNHVTTIDKDYDIGKEFLTYMFYKNFIIPSFIKQKEIRSVKEVDRVFTNLNLKEK